MERLKGTFRAVAKKSTYKYPWKLRKKGLKGTFYQKSTFFAKLTYYCMSTDTTTLFLIPTVLAEGTAERVLSPQVREVIQPLDVFFVENVRTARRFISGLRLGKVMGEDVMR
ncbi:hypothetical protein [Rhabdobacter roseus]|uniref:hypothetical protein n=1 Tax=Rhabdobacter roseus TaxID=1655419 RepID=UPI001607374C